VKRGFDDHERDEFIENSFEYIARFFEGSLSELSARNSNIETRFKRNSPTSFSANIYDRGDRIAQCSIRQGTDLGTRGIYFSQDPNPASTSFNEQLTVTDDGYVLLLQALGMQFTQPPENEMLSQEGAAEYLWSLLIQPLQ